MENQDKLYLGLLIILSLFALYPFFSSGFFGYDFVFQGARLASFYKNLQEGVILPRWAGNLNSGYGHPVLIFLYPFVFYLGSFWHFLGFSIVDSIKALFCAGFILSGIFMYLFARKIWSKKIAFLVAFVYLYSPFRFVNMYDRAALGEHMAMSFAPLIFLSLTNLYQSKKKLLKPLVFLSISFALTILAHNLIFIMAFPLIFIFWLYLILKYKNKSTKHFFFSLAGLALGISLSAFFWVPVIFEKIYTLYDQFANPSFYTISVLPLYQLFLSANYRIFSHLRFNGSNFVYSTISPVQWFAFLLGIIFVVKFRKGKTRESLVIICLLLYFMLGAYLTTDKSLLLLKIFPQIALVQQAFRFFNIITLVSPLLLGFTLNLFRKKLNLIILLIILINFVSNLPFFINLKVEKHYYDDKYFYYEYAQTADTGVLTPPWTLVSYDTRPTSKVQLGIGDLQSLEIIKWTSQEHEYRLSTLKPSQMVENTIYFPGWKLWVDSEETMISYKEGNWIGVITYSVQPGTHYIKTKFGETKRRLAGDYLSLGSLIIILILVLVNLFRYQKLCFLNLTS